MELALDRSINSGMLASAQPRTAHTTTPTSYERFMDEVWLPAMTARMAQ